MAESFLATITTKSRASNGRGRWDMCIREASATSWIINTKVSTLILFVEQTPGVGAQRERAATRGAKKKKKNEHAGQGAAARGAVWYEQGAIIFLVEIGTKLLSRYCTPEALPQVVLACVREAQGARGASAREKQSPRSKNSFNGRV